jgi:GT2 family glycosyltransferase
MGPFDRSLWVEGESGLYETANLFVRRDLFERLGGFEVWLEPEVGKPLAEDVWLGWRARRAGARTAFCPDAVVHHAVIARDPWEYVTDRRRLVHFPAIAALVPEVRDSLFFANWFLSRRSAAFDGALVALAAAAGGRSRLAALGAAPYAWTIARRSLESGSQAPLVAAVEVAADAVGLVSLVRGSLRSRAPVF